MEQKHDLVIIGAGVSGAAQYYVAAKYAGFGSVLLLEKESDAGLINSAATMNSQTLHEGDIETNYNFEKAKAVKHKSAFTRDYLERTKADRHGELYLRGPKMVLGVGEKEVSFLEDRYAAFGDLYPTLQKLDRDEIAARDPKIVEGRAKGEFIVGLYNENGLTINYGKLAEALIADGQEIFTAAPKCVGQVRFDTKVQNIKKVDTGYELTLHTGEVVLTRYLSVCAGAHSMYFAKQMGIEQVSTRSLMLVAGNFYYTPKVLNSKVYTVQNPKLPFSAVHGDPDILNQDTKTRYGPTTRVVAQLERGRFATTFEYLGTVSPLFASFFAYARIMFDREFFFYAFKHNVLFLIPGLGNYLFVKEIRKIIPTMKTGDLSRAKGQGGVRPQIVQTTERNPLNLGEAKISEPGVRFNVTPSPGATTCVFNGLTDIAAIARELGVSFDAEAVVADFGQPLDVQ